MIDGFSLLLSHVLVLLVFWRVLSRPDLDQEDDSGPGTTDA
ncbi:hypothetical protein PX699_06810 [Sphingobium sp. H39-3-25]|jgi:hypothetical protein|nr:hypothetical protein [Sphingobium arseniciresistens]